MASYSWPDYSRLAGMLNRLADPDPTPLLEEWEDVIREDNRRGILVTQTDCRGNPMVPVKYRPKGAPQRPTRAQQNRAGRRGVFAGLGPHAAGLNNNLTTSEYKRLGGPPLAPRGPNSRVITNLVTVHSTAPVGGEWFAAGYWDEVVSMRGVMFLPAHFTGANTGRGGRTKLPVRDLRGIRPQGRMEALKALKRWGRSLLKGT